MPREFLTTPERLRYQTVPASLLETDIRQHFYLTGADRAFLTPFRGAANRLGLALQLGVLRLMGFLPEAWTSQLPPEAVAFVATQVATEAAHLLHYGARQQTRSDHLLAVLRHLGFRKWEPLDAAWFEPWLVERALEHDDDRVLLAMTCLKLHQACIARPAIGTLERLVGGISDLATQETYRRLAPLLTDEVRRQLDALLLPEAGRNLTRHRWLVQPATVSNPAAIVTALDKLRYLDGLGVASWDVSQLHPNRQKRLALLARSRSNRHLEAIPIGIKLGS